MPLKGAQVKTKKPPLEEPGKKTAVFIKKKNNMPEF